MNWDNLLKRAFILFDYEISSLMLKIIRSIFTFLVAAVVIYIDLD